MKEFGESLPEDKKAPVQEALDKLKDVHKTQDMEGIAKAKEELTTVWATVSEEIYKAAQAAGAGPDGAAPPPPGADAGAGGNGEDAKTADNVTDVEFEEVEDDKK